MARPTDVDGAGSSPSARKDERSEGKDPYREHFERSADAFLIIEDGTFVDCNQATVEMLHCVDKAHVLRTHPSELSPKRQPDGRESFEKANEMIATAFAEGSHRFEWAHRRAGGEVFPVEVLLTAVQDRGKSILHVVWRDISERKRLENQLRHSQKMEAIGKLAGGIAHDFNNLLVAIIGHADLLSEDLSSQPGLLESVEQIQSASARAAALVRQLLAFSRKQDIEPQILDLNRVVKDLEKLLVRLLGEDIHLVTTSSSDAIQILADPGQIEQIIINLATNSRDAMPEGGKLSLEVRKLRVTSSTIGMTHEVEPGLYALLLVSDTGSGMDDETMSRAFDPFYTTKEVGKGTGLGLATAYGIVEQSGGIIDLHSTLGQGTTVKVYLPIATGALTTPSVPAPRMPTQGGSETILVVEDEAAVSRLIARVLRSRGYEVLQANDGLEALQIWRLHDGKIDLLLTDVVMPNMGGVELVQELRKAGHDPRVLFASGYTNDALTGLREVDEQIDLLHKPFSTEELVGRIRLALD